MWAIFKPLKYGFGDFTMYDYMGGRVNPLTVTDYHAWGIQFFLSHLLLTISLEPKKPMNRNSDPHEVSQCFLTELLPTLPFCLIEIHSLS